MTLAHGLVVGAVLALVLARALWHRYSEAVRCAIRGVHRDTETCIAVSSAFIREATVSAPARPKVHRGLLSSWGGEENTQASITRLSTGISPARTGEPVGGFSRGRAHVEASR